MKLRDSSELIEDLRTQIVSIFLINFIGELKE